MTVSWRRSAPCDAERTSGVAHWLQNLALGGLAALHDGHRNCSGAAQALQNLASGGLSC
jgi:hypothetical protein